MNRVCNICGFDDANILCTKCGQIICDNCYEPLTGECIKCSAARKGQDNKKRHLINFRVFGMVFMTVGLFITAVTKCIFVEGESNAVCETIL